MKTMAEVLEEVDAKWCSEVGCATSAEWAEYMADALSAAGFGPVREAQAQALRDAADAIVVPGASSVAAEWLRNRAAAIEATP